MTKEDKYFDELLRNKFAEHEVKPPAYVWEKIAEVQQAKRRKKLFLYYKVSGIAAAILLAFIFGWQINSQLQSNKVEPALVQSEVNSDLNTSIAEQKSNVPTEEPEADEFLTEEIPVEQIEKTTIKKENKQFALNTVTEKNELKDRSQLVFSFLRSIQIPKLSFEYSTENLQPTTRSATKKQQTLTAEDFETIKRNEQLLAMNETTENNQGNNWQIAAMVAPAYSVNQTSYQSSYASNMSIPGSKDNLSLGGGLAVEYKAGKRLSIQSGFYYSQLEQGSSNAGLSRNNVDNIVESDNAGYFFNSAAVQVKSDQVFLNASAGIIEVDELPTEAVIGNSLEAKTTEDAVLLTSADFQQNFEYVEIPFNLRYKLIDGGFDISLLGGFSTNFLIGNDVYLTNGEKERIGETKNMNKLSYSTTIGMGLDYGISDHISVRLEPQIKYYLGSLNNSSAVNFKPYTIGIYTGLSYRF
ncbi:hypothetical protein ACUNWD_05255 [Sunxiuqinia sp. A32]|uniref:hypothetical protein n=1 Tax=Sunxiuqinia sp. A32 TaxID=3461496 RepID=UPI0040453646